MIASENFVPQAILECQGSVLTNKYAEGYPGQALLRRLRVRRHRRAARDRPREGALRRRARQRPAARRRAGQRRRLPRAAAAGRHDHGPRAAPRRPPHARHEAQRVRAPLRHRALRGRRARRACIDMDEVERIAHERRPKLILAGWSRLPAHLDFERFRAIADEVGALPDGRHGALRRPRRGRRAPQPGALRRRRHHDGPQDARRRARRHDPLPRGVRQEDQLGRLPRPAGRPARARHRRQGGGASGSPQTELFRERQRRTRRRRQGAGRGAARRRRTASTC